MTSRSPIIAVDFDDTLYNTVSDQIMPGAVEVLNKLHSAGWKIIIWTCRENDSSFVREFLETHGIPFDEINQNIGDGDFNSRKVYFDLVVDDKNVPFDGNWHNVLSYITGKGDYIRKKTDVSGLNGKAYIVDVDTGDQRSEYPVVGGEVEVFSGRKVPMEKFSRLVSINGTQRVKYVLEYFKNNVLQKKEID